MSNFTAEFIGTAILLLLGNGVVCNVVLEGTKGQNSGWIVITMGWAMAVFVAVFVTADYSGAHLNPAVSIGLACAGLFDWAMVPTYIAGQLLGAAFGTTLAWFMHIPHVKITENKDLKLAIFSTIPAIPDRFQNFFSEFLGTFVLVFCILFIAPAQLVQPSSPDVEFGLGALGALPVAFLVLVIGLALGGTTGYAINPARDLGPRIMHALLPVHKKGSSQWHYAWIPVVGPIAGAALAGFLSLWFL